MFSATMHTLGFAFDRKRQALVFTGALENGFAFEVAFPIGHVTMTFDREAAEMGYCGEPLLGSVDTVDSFLGAVEVMHRRETGTELGYIELGAVSTPSELFKRPYKRGTETDPFGYVTPQIAAAERLTPLEQASILAEKYNVGLRVSPVAMASKPYKRGTMTDPLGYLTPQIIAANRLTPGEVTSIHEAQFRADHPSDYAIYKKFLEDRHRAASGGFFKSVASVAKAVAKPVSTAVKAYVNTVKKVGQQAVKYAKAGIRSKYVGYALAGAAVAFPAIGAPALAAYGAANRALAAYEDARKGVATAQKAVKTISNNAKLLTQSNAPSARMALAGLQAVPIRR